MHQKCIKIHNSDANGRKSADGSSVGCIDWDIREVKRNSFMATLSLCMIVRDEEEVLGRCLESVKALADEIIIVDTGSEDRTKEIAARYTDRVYDFRWTGDFSAARNYAFSKGTKDYLMWLDADDVLRPDEAAKFIEFMQTLPGDTDVVMMPYAVCFDEAGRSTFTYYRERIVRNRAGYRFQGRVHEVIPPSGRVVYSDIRVEHHKIKETDSDRNLNIYEEMERGGEMFDSRSLYYYGRELLNHRKYEKAADILERFLERPDGWLENRIDAARKLAVCHYRQGNEEKFLESLFRTFGYDVPRGEICCDLGGYFMNREKYEQAVFWYKEALNAKKVPESGAFIEEECYGYLPAISLCVCYDRMGNRKEAVRYNELAGAYKPESPYYLSNREYFESLDPL